MPIIDDLFADPSTALAVPPTALPFFLGSELQPDGSHRIEVRHNTPQEAKHALYLTARAQYEAFAFSDEQYRWRGCAKPQNGEVELSVASGLDRWCAVVRKTAKGTGKMYCGKIHAATSEQLCLTALCAGLLAAPDRRSCRVLASSHYGDLLRSATALSPYCDEAAAATDSALLLGFLAAGREFSFSVFDDPEVEKIPKPLAKAFDGCMVERSTFDSVPLFLHAASV